MMVLMRAWNGPSSSWLRARARLSSSPERWFMRSCICCRSRRLASLAAGDSAIDAWSNACTAESSCCCSFCTSSRIPWNSRAKVDSAAVYPGVLSRIVRERMNAIRCGVALAVAPVVERAPGVDWPCAITGPKIPRVRHTTTARRIHAPWNRTSEEIAEFEVQFPARDRLAERVDPVEAVGEVEAEGAERRDDVDPDPRPAEQPGGVPIDGPGPEVPGVEERVHVEHLGHAQPDLPGHQEVRFAERRRGRPGRVGGRIIALRGD